MAELVPETQALPGTQHLMQSQPPVMGSTAVKGVVGEMRAERKKEAVGQYQKQRLVMCRRGWEQGRLAEIPSTPGQSTL